MGDSVKKYYDTMTKNSEIYQYRNTEHQLDFPIKVKKDKHVQSVKEKFEKRSNVGIKKYNTTLEREDIDLLGWCIHAQEEAMDLTLYLEKIMDVIKEKGLGKN